MHKNIATITVGAIVFLAASTLLATYAGVRINGTGSYPRGIYLMTDTPIQKGSLVIFCPPDNPIFHEARARGYIGAGFCPGGYGYMIKKILAAEHDRVEMSDAGVFVNGELLPNSKAMHDDSEGRPLLPLTATIASLGTHSVLLMSDYSGKSFDARYFGLVDKANIIRTVRPLWTW